MMLKKMVEHTGMTQKNFALKAGISPSYLSAIMNGSKELSGSVIERLAEQYGQTFNIGWLLTGKGEMLLESRQMTLEEKIDQLPVVRAGIVDGKLLDRIDKLEQEVMLLKIKYESLKNS